MAKIKIEKFKLLEEATSALVLAEVLYLRTKLY